MKKLFLIVLLTSLLLLAVTSNLAFAETASTPAVAEESDGDPVTQESAVLLSTDEFVEQLCELNKELGNAKKSEDIDAAKHNLVAFLTEQFRLALGEDPSLYVKDDEAAADGNVPESAVKERYFSDGNTSGYNIQAKLDVEGTDECIVVGAHYDAVGEGANDNACGVATLLLAMQRLSQVKPNFDVYFVAFDCEEDGLVGSSFYVNNQLPVKADKVMMMFNVDSIASGSNLYVACENKRTDIADLILSKNSKLVEKSYTKGVYVGYDLYGYGYDEFVQGSDHTPFRLSGIPTATIFSGSYDLLGYVDDSGVMNTSDDTFANLKKSNLNFAERISAVSDVLCDTITDEGFYDVAQNARKQLVNNNLLYNSWWPSLVILGVLILLAVFTWLYHRKLQKKAILGTAEVKSNNVFDKPSTEDVFSFDKRDDEKSDNDSDVDGIFTFKK